MEEGIVIDAKDFFTLHPHADKQAIIDTIRFAGVFIFLVDWCVKLAYLRRSKFAILQIRELYLSFLYWRAGFVGIYHLVLVFLYCH